MNPRQSTYVTRNLSYVIEKLVLCDWEACKSSAMMNLYCSFIDVGQLCTTCMLVAHGQQSNPMASVTSTSNWPSLHGRNMNCKKITYNTWLKQKVILFIIVVPCIIPNCCKLLFPCTWFLYKRLKSTYEFKGWHKSLLAFEAYTIVPRWWKSNVDVPLS